MEAAKKAPIRLRPHHLLCTQGYRGNGYNEEFVKNMDAITQRLRNEDGLEIDVVFSTDDLCACCPHKVREGVCVNDDKVRYFDDCVKTYFSVREQRYVYRDLIREIDRRMTEELFCRICGRCEWFPFSACRASILSQRA